jgi:dihydroorotate dehydrogenase (fumarate)
VSGGVHEAEDAIKAIMTGAHGVQLVSALLRRGPEHLARVLSDLREWLEQHEYDSLEQMRGSMNLKRCPDPRGYERANYVQLLQSWRFELD